MNLSAFPRERRACMRPSELASLYGNWPNAPETVPVLAEVFDELLDESELVGLVADASELAARLDVPAATRRLAACVASAAESALAGGLTAWDRVVDVIEAGEAVRAEGL